MRDRFVSTLMGLAANDPNVHLVTGDLGFGVLKPFWERFPEQFTNAGIAEQNMTSFAAGMALEGKTVGVTGVPSDAAVLDTIIRDDGGDPTKVRRQPKKKPPDGTVSWGEPTFVRLVGAEPEPLASTLAVTHSLVLNMLDRAGDGRAAEQHRRRDRTGGGVQVEHPQGAWTPGGDPGREVSGPDPPLGSEFHGDPADGPCPTASPLVGTRLPDQAGQPGRTTGHRRGQSRGMGVVEFEPGVCARGSEQERLRGGGHGQRRLPPVQYVFRSGHDVLHRIALRRLVTCP